MELSLENKLEEILWIQYPIIIIPIEPQDGGGHLAYYPDFGNTACSATGDSIEEALILLEEVRGDVLKYYLDNNLEIPEPSPDPVFSCRKNQVVLDIPETDENGYCNTNCPLFLHQEWYLECGADLHEEVNLLDREYGRHNPIKPGLRCPRHKK